MDKVILRNLLARGKIGLSERETARPQDLLVNVQIETNTQKAAQSDDIADCIDYSELTKSILALVEHNEKRTVEALTEDIANLCLAHPLATAVTVRIEKTSAVRFTEAVGIEISRTKA